MSRWVWVAAVAASCVRGCHLTKALTALRCVGEARSEVHRIIAEVFFELGVLDAPVAPRRLPGESRRQVHQPRSN